VSLVTRVERLLAGSPFEPWARLVYRRVHSIGRPRVRQSLEYDRAMGRIMARIPQPDSSCADVGAHRGSVLEEIVRLAPRGRHFAFEPLPDLAARLRRRFPRVTVHQVALGDTAGASVYYRVLDDLGRSGLRRIIRPGQQSRVEELQVRTERLDDLIPPDLTLRFLKIDVEGAQLQVLRGGEDAGAEFCFVAQP
jgi:FkbM family methyltransferase